MDGEKNIGIIWFGWLNCVLDIEAYIWEKWLMAPSRFVSVLNERDTLSRFIILSQEDYVNGIGIYVTEPKDFTSFLSQDAT